MIDSKRRFFLKGASSALFLSLSPFSNAATSIKNSSILAVRIWPSPDYTRVTIEMDQSIKFNQFVVENPDRLVVDMEGVQLNTILSSISGKVGIDDPQIKLLRAAENKPGTVRLVMELKQKVKPQVFELTPVGEYGHRLVLDVYPEVAPDPLLSLIEAQENKVEPSKEFQLSENKIEAPEVHTSKKSGKPIVDRLVTVMLDPGHGGEDPGAVGKAGSFEKNVTLSIAKRLQKQINQETNFRALLTRDSDFFVPLHMRVQKARNVKSDLFLSIHADAWIKPEAKGSSVFVLSERGASSAQAKMLAQKENDADLIGGIQLKTKDMFLAKTLLDLSQTATNSDSLKLAKHLLNELGHINTLHKSGVEQAGFAVLKAPDIPSALIETAFISNPEEEQKLNDEHYQETIAGAIVQGIRQYFIQHPNVAKNPIM